MDKEDIKNLARKTQEVSANAGNRIAKTAKDITKSTGDTVNLAMGKIRDSIEEKKEMQQKNREEEVRLAMEILHDTEAAEFIKSLGKSPLELTSKRIKQIKLSFPIPKEHCVLWSDAEFDLRPSGIACTEEGVFIRTNVNVFNNKQKTKDAKDANDKSTLFYYKWDSFEAGWFISDSKEENRALLVEAPYGTKFINACKKANEQKKLESERMEAFHFDDERNGQVVSKVAPIVESAIESAEKAIFVEQKSHVNTPSGHGEMVEQANNRVDRLVGLDAKVVGQNNAKNGADRIVGGVNIQSKYHNSSRGSLEACFNHDNGQYRYLNKDGTPMQLEVAKDQYVKVLEGFKKKIADGKVPGVNDPEKAYEIVRKGRLTYKQAVNLTKPGTIESLVYDAATGVVSCSYAFGISCAATMFFTWRETKDLQQTVQTGLCAGAQVFGFSFLNHVLISQVARTEAANSLMAPSQYLVTKMGSQASANIVNGIRALSGKSPIYGAAASKHLAKVLRSNVFTSAVTLTVFSIPETYNLASKKISVAQYTKNISTLAGSIVAGAGGAIGAGIAAAKIAGIAGTTIAPGVGTAVGIAGGFVGGTVGAKAVDTVGDIFCEDDIETIGRLFNALVSWNINEYLLDADEIDSVINNINKVSQKQFKALFMYVKKAEKQEDTIQEFLVPIFESVVNEREKFYLPGDDSLIQEVANMIC